MSTESERRAQILANAQRRAQQAPVASPIQNPAPMVAAPPVAARPPSDVIAPGGEKAFTITRVPKGTKPGTQAAGAAPRTGNPGHVQVGATRSRDRGQQGNVQQVTGTRSPNVQTRQGPARGGITMTPGHGAGVPGQSVAQPQRQQAPAAPLQRSTAPTVDCGMVLAYHTRPNLVDTQLRALAAMSVQPITTIAWMNPSPVPFPDAVWRSLAQIETVPPSIDMNPWMRWAMAGQCKTEYVVILDDDCIPGPQWLKNALDRLAVGGEHDVVVAAGVSYDADEPTAFHPVGPEQLPNAEGSPDVGRGGWVMHTETARRIAASPRFDEYLSTGLHVAAMIQDMGGVHILLPYTADRSTWGMLEAPRRENSMSTIAAEAVKTGQQIVPPDVLRQQLYYAYRGAGWMPAVVAAAEPTLRTTPVPEGTEAAQ